MKNISKEISLIYHFENEKSCTVFETKMMECAKYCPRTNVHSMKYKECAMCWDNNQKKCMLM